MRKILENGFPNSFPLNRQHETPHGPNILAVSYRFSQVQNDLLRFLTSRSNSRGWAFIPALKGEVLDSGGFDKK